MLEFKRSAAPPHLHVWCGARIAFGDLVERAPALEQALERLGPGAVITCDASRLKAVDAEAVGVLCYLVLCAFHAAPRAVIATATRPTVPAALCVFARRADPGGCLHLVDGPEGFDEVLARIHDG